MPRQQQFAIMLPIPGWADGAQLSVNGQPSGGQLRPATYARIARTWSAGEHGPPAPANEPTAD